MILKQIFLLFFVLIYLNINSQVHNNKEDYTKYSCLFSEKKTFVKKTLSVNKRNSEKLNIKYIIPVKFWIIRSDSKDQSFKLKYLKELIQYLNYYYSINNTGIRFSLRPDFEYIDKKKLLTLHYYSQAPIQALKRNSKACINVIITGKLIKQKFLISQKRKFAGTYNPFFKTVIISRNTSTSTLSHEIGHYLGLKHPHRGWKHKWFQEPVSRSKTMHLSKKKMCERRGDRLCDTPAEPNLTKYTNKNCNYTGWNVTDKYGEVYKPNTHNIMSYTNNRECRNKFTKQQIDLMLNTLSKNKYAKFWKTNTDNNQRYFPDAFEPDNFKEAATEIFFNTPQIHSFHFSYTGKNKPEIPDIEDWLFFELKTKNPQTINLKVSDINNSFTEIKISIFQNSTLISEKNISKHTLPDKISIIDAIPGKYTVKIQQIVKTEKKTFYKILLNN